jgi:FkbM family methyltransferase
MQIYIDKIKEFTTITPKNVLEIGSRDGNDAFYLKNHYNINDNKVWVVEPNPSQVEIIRNTYPNFNIIPNAVFTENTEHDFYQVSGVPDDVGTSSLINRNDTWYENKSNIIKVKTITGKDLLDQIGEEIDLCKLDVEGLTYEVLTSFGDDLEKIKSFHLECEHVEVWKSQKLYSDVSDFLLQNNYTQIFFEHCSGGTIQSDSIWVVNSMIKE